MRVQGQGGAGCRRFVVSPEADMSLEELLVKSVPGGDIQLPRMRGTAVRKQLLKLILGFVARPIRGVSESWN